VPSTPWNISISCCNIFLYYIFIRESEKPSGFIPLKGSYNKSNYYILVFNPYEGVSIKKGLDLVLYEHKSIAYKLGNPNWAIM
jgi:hypothetical protein